MANLTMTNWHIQDKIPYLNLGSAGESNASTVTITVDALIEDANYYLDIGDENGSGLPNTQELKTHTSVGTNGETVYTLSMQPLVAWLGREGVKLLQVRCVYEEDNEQVVKESNVFHAKVDRNSGFVYKYNIAVFEEYLEKIKVIVAKVINTLSLHSLTDVSIHHPQNNQVLTYDDEIEKWKNKDIADFDYVTNDELSTTLDNYPTKSEITEDLEPYATKSEVSTTLESYETKQELNSTLESYATKTFVGTTLESYPTKSEINTTLADYVTDTSLVTTLENYVTNSDLGTTLSNYPTKTEVNTTLTSYQKQELTTPITIDGSQKTSVEGALSGLNGAVDKRVTYEYNGKVGAKNLLVYPYLIKQKTENGVSWDSTITNDGRIVVNGHPENYSSLEFAYYNDNFKIDYILTEGDYTATLAGCEGHNIALRLRLVYLTTNSVVDKGNVIKPTYKLTFNISQQEAEDIRNGDARFEIRIFTQDTSDTFENLVVSPMLRYASDVDDTWQPYAPTNRDLFLNKMDNVNPTGTGALSLNRRPNTTVGSNSIAIGNNVVATAGYSASFGNNSEARGTASISAGNFTTTGYTAQAAIGQYNNNKSTTFFEVGNGADINNRSNAFEVYSDGSLSTDNGTTKVKLEDVVTYTTNQHILDFTDSNAHRFGANFDQYSSYTLNRYDNKIILSQNNISISSSSADKLWIYRIFELLDITTLLNKGCIIELDITNSNVTSDNCLKLSKIVFSSAATDWRHAVNITNDISEYNYNIVNNKIIIDIDTLYNRYKTQIENNVLPYSDNIYLIIGGEQTITTVVDNEYKYNTPTTITIQGVYTLLKDRKQALNNYYTKQESDNRFQTKSINNIVCWGDSLTAMNGWTQTLQELSGINVYNAGTGGETSQTIMARQGGDVMIVDNIIIPSTTTAVTIASRSSDGGINTELGNVVTPLLQRGVHVNPVIIDNIKGNLTWTGSSGSDMNGTWTFTRLTSGDELVINRPTAIRTNFDINHNNNGDLMIIFMGQNGGWSSNDELIRQHKLMIDHFKGKEYIILGLSSGSADSRASYESAMKQAFGRRFISLREYLAHPIYDGNGNIISCYGLADQNLEPSTKEYNGVTYVALDEIAQGIVPHQLLIDSVHYTEGTREVIGKMLYKKLVELNIL